MALRISNRIHRGIKKRDQFKAKIRVQIIAEVQLQEYVVQVLCTLLEEFTWQLCSYQLNMSKTMLKSQNYEYYCDAV